MKIIKHEIDVNSDIEQVLEIHQYSYFLDIQLQNDKVVIWTIELVDRPKEKIIIEWYKTGERIPDTLKHSRSYLGTVQVSGIEWHFFEQCSFGGKHTHP